MGYPHSVIEYIYFFHGLSLLLLAAVCFFLRKEHYPAPAWAWLGFFGLMHWFYTWLDRLALQLSDWQAFSALRTAIMALSYILLLEFGRRTLRNSGEKTPALLIYTPLLLAAPFGLVYDVNAFNTSVRYVLGFSAGILSAWAIYKVSYKSAASLHQPLLFLGIGLFFYALTAGCVTPASQLVPAHWLNYDSFSRIFGFPVELLRALAAASITLSAYVYMQRVSRAKTAHKKYGVNANRWKGTRQAAGIL